METSRLRPNKKRIGVSILSSALFLFTLSTRGADVKMQALHRLQILEENASAFEARLQLIEKAEKEIIVETIIWDRDFSGSLIARALVDKKLKTPQIRIRVLVDSLPFALGIDEFVAEKFRQVGIEVGHYNYQSVLNFNEINRRNHRKLFASEKEFIIGGRNISDHYFELASDTNFIDRDLRIEGPLLREVLKTFEEYWDSPHTKTPLRLVAPEMNQFRSGRARDLTRSPEVTSYDSLTDRQAFEKALRDWHQKKASAEIFVNSQLASEKDFFLLQRLRRAGEIGLARQPIFSVSSLRFVSDLADWSQPKATVTGPSLMEQISQAQRSIVIENGYIIPGDREWKIFRQLLQQNVQLKLIGNSLRAAHSELTAAALALRHLQNLSREGALVYLFRGDPLPEHTSPWPEVTHSKKFHTHAKSFVVDRKHCSIGTANFDPRSLKRLNSELAVFIDDGPFCQHLEQMIAERERGSETLNSAGLPANAEALQQEGFSAQMRSWLVPLLSPLLHSWF